jgi:hypothetical protein
MAETIILRRIRVLSLARILGLMYAAAGLLYSAMIFWSNVGRLGVSTFGPFSSGGPFGRASGALVMVVMPLYSGVIGAATGLVVAAGYNLLARLVGGVEIHLESKPPKPWRRTLADEPGPTGTV